MEQPRINPYVALAIGVLAVSASAIFVKLTTAPSGVIAFYRMFFTVLLMTPLFLLKYSSELRLITKRDWLYSAIAGIFLAFHFILWFESLNYTSVASSTVLVTLQPLFAFVGTYYFFKEKISSKAIVSGVIAIVGSIIISWGDFQISGSALFGDILSLIACALVTAYLLVGQTLRKRISLITYTFIIYSMSAITLFIYLLIVDAPLFSYPASDWMYFLLLALIPNLLGHTLFNWSLKWLSTSTISMAILFEPVGATILAFYILDEYVIWSQILGGFVVMVGISLFLLDERKIKQLKQRGV
ncbi:MULTISPECIES: DMT family transporter [unclassified Bacillus (in: firmicutes)]|uniref:DMT family transporter n=1 Tax=unclassified Bacillus (in: firmicutes) TaxID=185979 RepID=UPI0008F28638|nr:MULTISPECIES: DMT family transporter [unclassified Bacillus (in: firmicutes)]SFB14587.1 EamA domain-containing membrane protein RarD [Bacillus sp. UNCCL13]SFQ89693.1 EamA domain-containing membrane protein RarD [Bacillus sp. cl95]